MWMRDGKRLTVRSVFRAIILLYPKQFELQQGGQRTCSLNDDGYIPYQDLFHLQ